MKQRQTTEKIPAEIKIIFPFYCRNSLWIWVHLGIHVCVCAFRLTGVNMFVLYSTRSWPSALVKCSPRQATASPCTKTPAGNGRWTWLCCSWLETVRQEGGGWRMTDEAQKSEGNSSKVGIPEHLVVSWQKWLFENTKRPEVAVFTLFWDFHHQQEAAGSCDPAVHECTFSVVWGGWSCDFNTPTLVINSSLRKSKKSSCMWPKLTAHCNQNTHTFCCSVTQEK